MKEITSYQTSDNQIFQSKEDAIKHEQWLSFQEWYNGDKIIPILSKQELFDWIINNKHNIIKMLNPTPEQPFNQEEFYKELDRLKQKDWTWPPYNPIQPFGPTPFDPNKIWCSTQYENIN